MINRLFISISILILAPFTIFAKELKIIKAEEFFSANPTLERKAILDFAVKQFSKKNIQGVSQKELDLLWNDPEIKKAMHLTRFQIVNQALYADSYDLNDIYFKPLFHYLNDLVKKYRINDVDFIIYARDEILESKGLAKKTLNVPAFMMSKNNQSLYEKDKLLLPDAFMIQDNMWKNLIIRIEEANLSNDWQNKKDKIFWRGGPHGSESKYLYNISNFDKLARLKLVLFSKLYPNIIDAKFIASYGEFSKDKDGDNLKYVLDLLEVQSSNRVSESEHLKYKYLVAIDGNTCPWLRVPWIMLSNSVLVKQETSNVEWFYSSLKPYVHYVPIKKDLTDIFDKIEWLKSHDEEAHKISINAQNFIRNELMPEHIEAHMVLILNEYATIQTDKKIIPTLLNVEEIETKLSIFHKTSEEINTKSKLSKKIKQHWKSFKNNLKKLLNRIYILCIQNSSYQKRYCF